MASRTVYLFVVVVFSAALGEESDPLGVQLQAPLPTEGVPWPMPQVYQPTNVTQTLNQEGFSFRVVGMTCDILEAAVDRYFKLIFYPDGLGNVRHRRDADGDTDDVLRFHPKDVGRTVNSAKDEASTGDMKGTELTSLTVMLMQSCEEYPAFHMDEKYQLSVTTGDAKLLSDSIWGILHGLQTFGQLVYEDNEGTFTINSTVIEDYPRFSHRGIMLDTSRHYLPKGVLLQNLDAMAYNKINVFHWHIVDENSFPYQSRDYPLLSEKGAYDPYTHIYTQEDVKEIIEYARMRGIRVVPEFDTPGHSLSWGQGQPGLLTKCYDKGNWTGTYGPIDPSKNSTYTFLSGFMKEVSEVFQDMYLHLGGDEVQFTCWKSNPEIQEFMTKMGFGTDYAKLEEYYIQNLVDIVDSCKRQYIVWQEVVDNGVKVEDDTVVHIWKQGYQEELARVTKVKLNVILSSPWYLNKISYGTDWPGYYRADPQHFNGTEAQKELVVGGEACLWGEWVDVTNVVSRLWPRASAVAERLWSAADVNDTVAAAPRLEEHRCRMLRHGINAEPVNGPSFCRYEGRVNW